MLVVRRNPLPDCATVESADHICSRNGMILVANVSVWWQLNSIVKKIVEIMDALKKQCAKL